ncbi:NADPH-dependent FMN reductase [Candidatus Xianfuyuplasma coldseepsis]|uniref:NAD(P)H-dependent oxidoreductase n=1 Tax=Candidatus Xianfuyuplasma coldseepsis TaxID=2782163 RepID=A0A7L7KPA5_9MOLU|nr:NAD(P)H-dependent oxidoreductase [Xianfuyuplasma coldseepsis]QMS84620.1 NAD(P)H-dependent oxidoreductase [Xianfuyuplasma coldseepsis]
MKKVNIGVILGSTREGRVSPQVGSWVVENLKNSDAANIELIDIKDYDLPFLGTSSNMDNVVRWNQKLEQLDGFIFVTAEYNHSIPGALKNALDSARDPWANKVAGIVSYGSAGGARAAEHLKNILTELQIAPVRTQVLLSLFTDFEQGSQFKPQPLHQTNLNTMMTQVLAWTNALRQK